MLRNASTIAKQLQLLHSLITSKHKYRQLRLKKRVKGVKTRYQWYITAG